MKRFKMLNMGRKRMPSVGYTIVEVMIFLAVSGGLLVASSSIISGRQEKTRFTQAVEGIEQNLQDVFNDVSTGYFPSNNDYDCTAVSTSPMLTTPSPDSEQGTNEGCIFIGKIIELPVNGEPNDYAIYTMVGVKTATSITSGGVKLLGFASGFGVSERNSNQVNLEIAKLVNTSTAEIYRAIAIVADFGANSGSAVTGNAARVKLYGYIPLITDTIDTRITQLKPIDSSVVVCLQQQGTNGRKASLKITQQLTVDRLIDKQEAGC